MVPNEKSITYVLTLGTSLATNPLILRTFNYKTYTTLALMLCKMSTLIRLPFSYEILKLIQTQFEIFILYTLQFYIFSNYVIYFQIYELK